MWCALRTVHFLEVDPKRAGAINTVLVSKGVRVNELRKQTKATLLVA